MAIYCAEWASRFVYLQFKTSCLLRRVAQPFCSLTVHKWLTTAHSTWRAETELTVHNEWAGMWQECVEGQFEELWRRLSAQTGGRHEETACVHLQMNKSQQCKGGTQKYVENFWKNNMPHCDKHERRWCVSAAATTSDASKNVFSLWQRVTWRHVSPFSRYNFKDPVTGEDQHNRVLTVF